jgi:hypothetical protein
MDHASTTKSYERSAEFINRVTNALNEPLPPSSYYCVNVKGELEPLKERQKKVLNWEKIGIVPMYRVSGSSKAGENHVTSKI